MSEHIKYYDQITAQTILIFQQIQNLAKTQQLDLHAQQKSQIVRLLLHAYKYSSFWRARLESINFNPSNPGHEFFYALPPLLRDDLQVSFEALRARWPELDQNTIYTSYSSGSTGLPVRVEKSLFFQKPLDDADALLDLHWHQRNANETIAFIGYQIEDKSLPSWGGIYHHLGYRGRYEKRSIANRSARSHLDWLQKIAPKYLRISPFLVEQIAKVANSASKPIKIDQIISVSERVSPAQRRIVEEVFGAKIIDRYSCEEVGMIALQCPLHDHLHALSPHVLVEIVDENNNHCVPGVPGRVLVTNLFSYAMPIIRYDLGDIAEWGTQCNCGINWPVIKNLWGRVRNIVTLPNGEKFPMPFLGDDLAKIPDIREFRLQQYRGHEIEMEVVSHSPLSKLDIDFIVDCMRRSGLIGLNLYLNQVTEIEWVPGKKRDEFVFINKPYCPIDNVLRIHI